MANSALYFVNDIIEIDDDGIARTVTSVGGTTVIFSPALPSPATSYAVVENWGPGATDFAEDFHLSQTAAGEGADSLCVDAGSDSAVNLGMDGGTTRSDAVTDSGTVDMGYHYSP